MCGILRRVFSNTAVLLAAAALLCTHSMYLISFFFCLLSVACSPKVHIFYSAPTFTRQATPRTLQATRGNCCATYTSQTRVPSLIQTPHHVWLYSCTTCMKKSSTVGTNSDQKKLSKRFVVRALFPALQRHQPNIVVWKAC